MTPDSYRANDGIMQSYSGVIADDDIRKQGDVQTHLEWTYFVFFGIGQNLFPGDELFLYTDGVTEASDEKQLFYETDRLLAALNAPGPANPNELLTAVQQCIQDFAGQAEQADDLTMLCIQYRGTETKDNTNI